MMLIQTIGTLLFINYVLGANTFIRPAANEIIQADGGSYAIQWTPDTADPVVSIALVNGTSPVATLANQIQNTGSFVWVIPRNLTAGRYTMAIAGGQSGATPTDFTSSGEFIITGDSAYSSSIASVSVASSISSVASSLNSQISSLSQSSASSVSAASGSSGSHSASTTSSGASAGGGAGSGSTTTTGASGGAVVGPSATGARTGETIGGTASSTRGSGTSGTEVVRHADFAVIIFALVCVLMQI